MFLRLNLSEHWRAWLSIFITAAVVIFLQVALTRILSAAADYHATFFVISTVMLALAAAGIRVYRKVYLKELSYAEVKRALIQGAIGVLAAYGLFAQVAVPLLGRDYTPVLFLASILIFYFPLERCGFAVAAILYLQRSRAAWIYWGDLLGAALAALIVVPLLSVFSAPNMFVICAIGLVAAAIIINHQEQRRSLVLWLLLLFLSIAAVSESLKPRFTFLPFANSIDNQTIIWERWNGLARISVFAERPDLGFKASPAWGLSRLFTGSTPPLKLLRLDGDAATPILKWNEDSDADYEFLKWDVTALAFELWEGDLDRVFIIGGGGGRDIITARLYGANEIHVAELNPAVVEATDQAFGDFSGRPYSWDQVKPVVGEGRNILSRHTQPFDLIQMSMIDTWAAAVAGAFSLAENNLYTREAFQLFLEKLSPTGVFSLSRWYYRETRGETGRALLMLAEALRNQGIENYRDHIVLVVVEGRLPVPVATILVSPSPFGDRRLEIIRQQSESKGYKMLWPAPAENAADASQAIAELLNPDFDPTTEKIFDLSTATDDRPFFFNLQRPFASWWQALRWQNLDYGSRNSFLFFFTLLLLAYASLRLIYRPAGSIRAKLEPDALLSTRQYRGLNLYFTGIGVGFMFIEIGLLQRFTIFLGHPLYSYSVILFCLLLFSAMGSLWSTKVLSNNSLRPFYLLVAALVAGTAFYALVLPDLLLYFYGQALWYRILFAAVLIMPVSLTMGMFLPFGLSLLNQQGKGDNIPLAWAVNGVASVIGSVLAVIIAMSFGYTLLMLLAALAYITTICGARFMRGASLLSNHP